MTDLESGIDAVVKHHVPDGRLLSCAGGEIAFRLPKTDAAKCAHHVKEYCLVYEYVVPVRALGWRTCPLREALMGIWHICWLPSKVHCTEHALRVVITCRAAGVDQSCFAVPLAGRRGRPAPYRAAV